jgi:hypothetical protein
VQEMLPESLPGRGKLRGAWPPWPTPPA